MLQSKITEIKKREENRETYMILSTLMADAKRESTEIGRTEGLPLEKIAETTKLSILKDAHR